MDPSIPSMSDNALIQALKQESTNIDPNVWHEARTGEDLFELGHRLNGIYELQSVLGKGGMGQVYEAYDHVLERTIAVKASWPHIEPGSLLQEARALAALAGHGVPAVFSMGKHDEIEYCVMERLYGRTLGSHMINRFQESVFEIDEAIDLLIGVADALSEVHDVGLVHRDLKPGNIMLCPGNRTVLFDFGLFLTRGATGNEGSLAGSPRYLAPETITSQVQSGQAHLVDIYSLGIIGFLLFTGRHPFSDRNAEVILRKQVSELPPPLSSLRPEVPWRLERLIGEMLAKEPLERPFSADAVAAELGTIRAELPPPIEFESELLEYGDVLLEGDPPSLDDGAAAIESNPPSVDPKALAQSLHEAESVPPRVDTTQSGSGAFGVPIKPHKPAE